MQIKIDIIGKKFGKLTGIGFLPMIGLWKKH